MRYLLPIFLLFSMSLTAPIASAQTGTIDVPETIYAGQTIDVTVSGFGAFEVTVLFWRNIDGDTFIMPVFCDGDGEATIYFLVPNWQTIEFRVAGSITKHHRTINQ